MTYLCHTITIRQEKSSQSMEISMTTRSEQTRNGLDRAVKRGRKLGPPFKVSDAAIRRVMAMGTAEAARKVGLTKAQYIIRRGRLEDQDAK